MAGFGILDKAKDLIKVFPTTKLKSKYRRIGENEQDGKRV